MRRLVLCLALCYGLMVGSAYAQASVISYTKMHYSRIEIAANPTKTQVTLTVYYKDPTAKTFLEYMGSHYTDKITYLVSVPVQTVNINRQVMLNSLLTGDSLNLYVAMYWVKTAMDAPMLCISVEPIPVNWYEQTVH